MTMEEIARFWLKAKEGGGPDPLDPCWEWQASLLGNGYGQFKLNGKPNYAHRIAWEIFNGPIPDTKQVCHRCDNPLCVKPYHLFVGSAKDNYLDSVKKGRRKQNEKRHGSGGQRGEKSNWAKLNIDQVLEIREMGTKGFPHRVIAEKFGVSRPAISLIVNRKNWTHI